MPTSPLPNTTIPNKYSTPVFLALIAAGLAGNYFNFPIFLNINFLFGSIFAMLALQLFGLGRGIPAAAIIAGYTWVLWNHPYAIIIMTAEVAVVGCLMERRKMGLVLADTLYWLLIGMPLVYIFYHFVMHIPPSNIQVIIIKQTVNGIANALVARLIFLGYAHGSRSLLVSYREIIYNLLGIFVLCPAVIMLLAEARADFEEIDLRIRTSLFKDIQRVDQRLENWVDNRKSAILILAEMAVSRSPQQMQPYLELAKRSDANFQYIALRDRKATNSAIFPLVDELGQNAIGKNYADRAYIPILKGPLKPMFSEVVMGRVGTPRPRVLMLAPVVIRGEYGGFVAGALDMDQIREYLDKSVDRHGALYTLIDKNGNIIMTNRTDQKVMTPFVRGKGTLNRLDDNISQWVPVVHPNTSVTERWGKSHYVTEIAIGDMAAWKLILEQPVAPWQKRLYDNFAEKLTMLFLMMLGAMVLAEFFSRRIVVTLGQLRTLTYELPIRLATNGAAIEWPESGIKETNHLINNFREMANTLSEQFFENRQINESLEQRVAERTESLQRSEEKFRALFESAKDGIFLCNSQGVIVSLNAAFADMHGYTPLEMVQMELKDLDTPETFRTSPERMRRLLAGEALIFEVEHYHKDGHIFPLEVSSSLISIGDEKYVIGFHRDITERKQTDEELRQAKASSESANIAKSRFLATMSHEIRTPMNGVIGMIQLLQHTELTPEQREYAESAKNSGIELVHLLNDILDLSKIEADKIELETSDFDLRPEVSDTINLLSLQAREKGVKLTSLIDSDVPTALKGDAGRLRQIIINLVGNAIKFTPQGAVTLQIRKDIEDENSVTLRFMVIDSGIGIAADKLEHIFESFTQADSSTTRQYGGTGLGLAICKRLSELMGGSIGAESTEGRGSTFWFTVVMEKQTYTAVPAPPSNLPQRGRVRDVNESLPAAIRILLTDDDPMSLKILPLLLKKYGYQVDVADNGNKALQALQENDYALVLMDCMMPEINGYEVTSIIRDPASAVRRHDIPVIALTGNAMKQDRDECVAAGMNDHLSKPLMLPDLLVKLDKWLNKYKIEE